MAQLTAAVQDYAKAIYTLESRDGEASTTALATLLEVRPASVSGMLHKLSALGLVEHERYRGIRLTKRGRRVALAASSPVRVSSSSSASRSAGRSSCASGRTCTPSARRSPARCASSGTAGHERRGLRGLPARRDSAPRGRRARPPGGDVRDARA